MGNRGCLHDAQGLVRHRYQGKRWIFCQLAFKGRHQTIMAPGHYTQLFFLDEATALAAGHRPCAECLRPRYNAYRACWSQATDESLNTLRADDIDQQLHQERLGTGELPLSYAAPIARMPDGTFIWHEGDAYLLWGNQMLLWAPAGYTALLPRPHAEYVQVLTPRSTMNVLAAGYPLELHPFFYRIIDPH